MTRIGRGVAVDAVLRAKELGQPDARRGGQDIHRALAGAVHAGAMGDEPATHAPQRLEVRGGEDVDAQLRLCGGRCRGGGSSGAGRKQGSPQRAEGGETKERATIHG